MRARGERHGRAKLTEAQVVAIRERYAKGVVLARELAAEYGVTRGVIARIVLGLVWAHADGPRTRRHATSAWSADMFTTD